MLLVNHYVNRSRIHGLGVFTSEPITAGSVVWRFDPMFDIEIPVSLIGQFSEDIVQMIRHHAEYVESLGVFRLGCDGDIFMNHSASPTLIDYGDEMRAARDLNADTELTCDYSDVCVLGFFEELPNLSQCAAE